MGLMAPGRTPSAAYSEDETHRFHLSHAWGPGPAMLWVMLRPGTEDVPRTDRTLRRCVGFAKREGCGAVDVVNLFSLRAEREAYLFDRLHGAPQSERNANAVRVAVSVALEREEPVVAAWGPSRYAHRSEAYRWLNSVAGHLLCLGHTTHRAPVHPLFVRADAALEAWA